ISAAYVGAHRDLPAVLTARDDTRAAYHLDMCELGERNASALACGHQNLPNPWNAFAGLRRVSDRDVEPSLAFEHRARCLAADCHLNHILHIAHVDAVARDLLTVDGNS